MLQTKNIWISKLIISCILNIYLTSRERFKVVTWERGKKKGRKNRSCSPKMDCQNQYEQHASHLSGTQSPSHAPCALQVTQQEEEPCPKSNQQHRFRHLSEKHINKNQYQRCGWCILFPWGALSSCKPWKEAFNLSKSLSINKSKQKMLLMERKREVFCWCIQLNYAPLHTRGRAKQK